MLTVEFNVFLIYCTLLFSFSRTGYRSFVSRRGHWPLTLAAMRRNGPVKNFIIGFIIGSVLGVTMQLIVLQCHKQTTPFVEDKHLQSDSQVATNRNLVLVGVMTAKQFLESRVVPAFDTWASTVPGKVD